jgi:surface protein
MGFMFSNCWSLEELNLSNFNTINVKNMAYMFNNCSEKLKNEVKEYYKNFREEAFLNF